MPQYNRFIAAYITFVIMSVIIAFGLGHYTTTLEELFSFSAQSLFVQIILGVALLIIVFFGRPRSHLHRTYFGAVATIVTLYGAHGAFTESLLLGDALIAVIGSIITVVEAVEESASVQPSQSSSSLPVKTEL